MANLTEENFRNRLHEITYEADTRVGKLFDLFLLSLIIIGIVGVMLESVASIQFRYDRELKIVAWVITTFFTLEYVALIFTVRQPWKCATSFTGIADLLFPGLHLLLALRALRLLMIFKILKLAHFVGTSDRLVLVLKKSRVKIAVFLFTVIVSCVILRTVTYMVDGPENGFNNIPVSICWTIVTLTTVEFGDITPQTALGQFISMAIIILGYRIIAVPTGIVTSKIVSNKASSNTQICPSCSADNHRDGAKFSYNCGLKLNA